MRELQKLTTNRRPVTAEARTVVERWPSETLARIDATEHMATPIDMEWLNGRIAASTACCSSWTGEKTQSHSVVRLTYRR